MPEINKEIFLGDGLYASWDGWQIKLRAPRMFENHEVFLEPIVYHHFRLFADACQLELKDAMEKAREADRRAKEEARQRQEPSPPVPGPDGGTKDSTTVQSTGHPTDPEKGTTDGDPGT